MNESRSDQSSARKVHRASTPKLKRDIKTKTKPGQNFENRDQICKNERETKSFDVSHHCFKRASQSVQENQSLRAGKDSEERNRRP